MPRRNLSPAALFQAAVHPGYEQALAEMQLEVVARPGTEAPTQALPGLVAISCGLGEGRLASVLAVQRLASRALLEAEGIGCDGSGEGIFMEVESDPGVPRGLRIAGRDGILRRDVVLLRERPMRRPSSPRPSEDEPSPAPLAALLAAVYALRDRRPRTVRREYLQSLLEPASGFSALRGDIRQAVTRLEQRRAGHSTGEDWVTAIRDAIDALAAAILNAAERVFILDVQRSSLELLETAERDRYLRFAWHANDFPGAPGGPNEGRANQMFAALSRLRAERRANQGTSGVVLRTEFDAAMRRRIADALVDVPGEGRQRLHREAAAAFVLARTAAAAEGVTLSIHSSYRPPEVAAAAAARAANPNAVAKFSSHMLGLAADLKMSHGSLRVSETTTRPFQNLVDMYKSPVHKWMFLRGEPYGWYPFQLEPWHWEYNPPGLRERFRQPAPATTTAPAAARPAAELAEAITDPVAPPRPPLALTASVGRGGRNRAADVGAVQDRLVELRAVDAAAIAAERATGAASLPESSLARTIEAIERFQRQAGVAVSGTVRPTGPTRTELDRDIPGPTPAELSAIAAALGTIGQAVRRGLTIRGPVGATDAGNAVDDVRAVQQRLVDVGRLSASHREGPAPGATGTVPRSALTATIAALRAFQADVRFFRGRRSIAGAITAGVVSAGDATAALLDRISVYDMTVGTTRLSFRDHVVSRATRSEAGVMFVGTASPSAVPQRAYTDLGLTAGQAEALRFVSNFEGNFDAINTYDAAIVSAGFIQFAGGRGLPPYVALLKARQPVKFADLLRKYGVDVEFRAPRGAVADARLVVVDAAGTRVLRGTAAETAIRENKRLTTALILSGRDRDVQLVQIEAAARDYVLPALNTVFAPSARGGRVRLGDILRSRKAMAALFDRAIQEGQAGHRRFRRVIQRMVRDSEPSPLPTPPPLPPTTAQLQSREGDILAAVERDLQAAADASANIARARSSLQDILRAAAGPGATVSALLARPELAAARRAVSDARAGMSDVVNVSTRGDVDTVIAGINTGLAAEGTRLALTPPPASVTDLSRALTASRAALEAIAPPLSTASGFLSRIQRVRRSTLDSALVEAA